MNASQRMPAVVTGVSSGIGRALAGEWARHGLVLVIALDLGLSRAATELEGAIAGFMAGSCRSVYNGTKAFIDSFSLALCNSKH